MRLYHKLLKVTAVICCGVVLLTGCATNDAGYTNKTNVGTVGGALAGAALGSTIGRGEGKFVAGALGAVLGAAAGNQFGKSLDRADLAYRDRALLNALEYNQRGASSTWHNPDSGNRGAVTPVRTYVDRGRDCREFTQEVIIGGRRQEAYGLACRSSDGAWQIVQP